MTFRLVCSICSRFFSSEADLSPSRQRCFTDLDAVFRLRGSPLFGEKGYRTKPFRRNAADLRNGSGVFFPVSQYRLCQEQVRSGPRASSAEGGVSPGTFQ